MNNNLFSKMVPLLLIISILFAFHSEKKSNLDDTTNKIAIPTESRVIIGQGATVIIKSNDQTNARILAKIIDVSQGGIVRELLNDNIINAGIKAEPETTEAVMGEVSLPLEFTIGRAYPNPFNPVINIQIGLPKEASVHILIYDVAGRLIGDYNVGSRSAGWHEFSWNAIDMLGQDVGTSIYLLTIQVGDILQKQKITYIK